MDTDNVLDNSEWSKRKIAKRWMRYKVFSNLICKKININNGIRDYVWYVGECIKNEGLKVSEKNIVKAGFRESGVKRYSFRGRYIPRTETERFIFVLGKDLLEFEAQHFKKGKTVSATINTIPKKSQSKKKIKISRSLIFSPSKSENIGITTHFGYGAITQFKDKNGYLPYLMELWEWILSNECYVQGFEREVLNPKVRNPKNKKIKVIDDKEKNWGFEAFEKFYGRCMVKPENNKK